MQVHVGTQNVNNQMSSYIYKRSKDGIHYMDISKTWEKTMVAARIVAATQSKNLKDVLVSAYLCSESKAFEFACCTLFQMTSLVSERVSEMECLQGNLSY